MTYNLFLRDYLVGFCIKVLNSAVVIGLYFGFLTTFSIGPSYLFLIRAHCLDEGSETKIAATTGFITGQLMMFISIYYVPVHLALNRPHTLTALTLPYLFFNYVYKNNKHYYSGYKLDSGYKNPNSIRDLRIYKVFFNNLFFQLLNPFLLPSSILIRLMNLYLFRSNNKLLFLTSSFVGWLIGHIFLMKCVGLVLVWLQQKNSIKSKITMRFDKYTLLQLRDYVGQIFVVLLFVTFLHYLGRTPLPYQYEEEVSDYDNRNVQDRKAEREAEEGETYVEEEEEDITVYLFDKKFYHKKKKHLWWYKSLVTTVFDYNRWYRPWRYIKNDRFEGGVRDENSQFFFQICESDGKKRISFTYPPDLSTFREIMEKKMDLFRRDKTFNNELSNSWRSRNKEKADKLINEFFQRAKLLDNKYKKLSPVDVFEHRIRLCDDTSETNYLIKMYDPFLNGRVRGESQLIEIYDDPFVSGGVIRENLKCLSPVSTEPTNFILINKIHGFLLCNNNNSDDPEFEQKIDQFDRKLLTEIGFFFNLINKFSEKSVSSLNLDGLHLFPEHEQVKIYSEEKKRKRKFLLDAIRTDTMGDTSFNTLLSTDIDEISKEVPRWNYEIVDELEVLMDLNPKESQIRSPQFIRYVCDLDTDPAERKVHFTKQARDADWESSRDDTFVVGYSHEPDYNREIIRGSMQPQRRKTVTYNIFQEAAHSPLFLEILGDYRFWLAELFYQHIKEYFRKPGTDNSEFLAFEKAIDEIQIDENKDNDEQRRLKVEADWESILYGLVIRSFVLLFQSYFRKYVLLPLLIITKNIIRILLFQNPEWLEDFRDWRKEVHLYCTYQGIPISYTCLPPDWFCEGMQIRILSPFVLKPWHNKVRSTEKKKKYTEKIVDTRKTQNYRFITGYGTLVEWYFEDHVPNPFLFLGPIFKKIKKELKKYLKNRFFRVEKVCNERKKEFGIEEKENWNIKSIPFRFKKRDELSESKKNSTISKSNSMIEESPVISQSMSWTNFTEKRIKDLNIKTKTILKQLEKMKEEQKEGVITLEINLNSSKTTYEKLELLKNRLQILKRRTVRLIRKSYYFFQILMGRIYREIILSISRIIMMYGQRFVTIIKLTDKIVNRFIYIYKKKKKELFLDKTKESLIPFLSIIDKSSNITDMNSENSCDVSSLSQAYVLFKLSQSQISNGYKYNLRSIFESHGRSFFLKNEIKDYFLRIQGHGGKLNSKLRHNNRPDSIMNQWRNWLKVHYQYTLPKSGWSRLVPQKWRKRMHEHRVVQNKNFEKCDSSDKKLVIFYKKQQVDLLEKKKKIKKQYGYDLFAYQYINYAGKKKSYIFDGYKSPFQANKKQRISYNYNIPKNEIEFFDIMGDRFIQNYIAQHNEDIVDSEMESMETKLNRKYLNLKRKNNSKTNNKLLTPRFEFFSKLSAYKKNPWILPIHFFFRPYYVNKNITDEIELLLQKKEQEREEDINLYFSSIFSNPEYKRMVRSRNSKKSLYRSDLLQEELFLQQNKLSFCVYLNEKSPVNDMIKTASEMTDLRFHMARYKHLKNIEILSIKRGQLDLETMLRARGSGERDYIEYRDIEEVKDYLLFSIEPTRLSRNMKNLDEFLIYQTISISCRHKRKIFKRDSEKSNVHQKRTEKKDEKNYDLLVPENLLSTRRRRELRILICLNARNRNTIDRNTINNNEKTIKNSSEVLTQNTDFDSDTKKLKNLKFFLWPNYRFEDLACMNRYWFDTHNGSRFSILRIHMYPRLKI